jgi:hypothetical protein
MRRRLYFVLPNLNSAKQTMNDLLLARIEERYMHFIARPDISIKELHEANILQKTDLIHGAELGAALGGLLGLIIGCMIVFSPPEGLAIPVGMMLATTLGGAFLGAWMSSMLAVTIPNSKLEIFKRDIKAGKILMMVDVPLGKVDEIHELVAKRHPEAVWRGVDPTIPAFP